MQKTHNHGIPRLTPVERAVLRQKWTHQAVTAQIHALMGDDVGAIAERAGSLFYVVLWACCGDQVPTDDVDRRVIRGAVMQVAELDGRACITDLQRNAVHAGLQAVTRLVPRLKADTMAAASHTLFHIARARPVTLRDFPPVDFPTIHHPAA